MRQNLIIFISTLQSLTGVLCNSGHSHDHAHDHGHHHHGEHVEREDLEDLIQNFGIAVLGKDQESADDVQPTADHSHVNIKALIDELFHPSSTTTTTTTTPATTSTQRLPIKAHELGWELSPIDLVMANSILEPVFSDDQKQQRGARGHQTSSYLTESPYLASLASGGLTKPPRSGKSLEDAEMSLNKGQLIDKPTLPVLDTRRANFLLVNGRKRSKTGRKLSNSNQRARSKDSRGSRPRFGQKTPQKSGHQQKKKKCEHDADDILWRETVSHQNFVTTSPHPFIRSDDTSTTDTPMMDISPFLQPPALSAISDIPDHQHSHDQEHQEESQEDSQGLLQSALGQVKADVISQESRRHPPSGPRANKKGKFVVRGKIRFKNRKKKGRSNSSSSVFKDKKSSANVFQAPRPPPQPSRRRGKKSDDNDRNHHVNHQHLSDEEVEEVIFQDTSSFSSGLTPRQDGSNTREQDRADSIQIQAAATKNKKFKPAENSALPVTEVHRVQDEHIHHHLMMSVTRSSPSITGDCVTSGEGLHADLGSGCQRFYMCHENGRSGRFTCPVGTLFSETLGVCDWARRVKCPSSSHVP